MQTPKSRDNSSGAPQRTSPRSSSSEVSRKNSAQAVSSPEASKKVSPRVVCQLKTSARYLEPTESSSNPKTNRAPKETSPKVSDRKSPRSQLPDQKKRPSRVAELESQIHQLENDLETVKDQLCSSETLKNQAQKDAEESNQKLLALSAKLEESQKKILEEQSSSHDSAALASALDEIKRLKLELEMVAEPEATLSELNKLKEKLAEANLLVEEMKDQLKNCKQSEAGAQEIVGETLMQLETAKKMVETLRSDGCKATVAYDGIAVELDQSRARVEFLEGLVSKLTAESRNAILEKNEGELIEKMKREVERLRLALEDAEMRCNEEKSRSAKEVRIAYEMVEKIKSESGMREAELEAELRKSKYEIEEWRANLMDKENELQGICEENDDLAMQLENSLSGRREQELETELKKLRARLENLKSCLAEKEKENEKLKSEIKETGESKDDILCDLETTRASEREALMKVGYMAEEVDKSKRKAARVEEQLEAAQKANVEMEGELRKLKVQLDQWRKAAEAAAAMLSVGNNGQFVERTGSMDSMYSPRRGYGDEVDEDLLKKKNANMLRRLWKKPLK
ncbi:hypothetical protein BUALT_Bualt02G0051700 [Buddleja alternifolia]|uniref:Interactor of constitutive active ROPs 3-like n=1 Tax=Buddleja alternifolia TaxID=168488 RepID=A0AAV6XYZ8_9LAMI|nr:hypothetical protein BUALT_Bualt02G0051700 [Buddleja alternifolia]